MLMSVIRLRLYYSPIYKWWPPAPAGAWLYRNSGPPPLK
ncbi:MAG: hypothetical protein CM1200mP29_10760 [Verrucomicrobiota bacterium]|nr:MAG: hypothetical protein CM1200mP29_10760 [Verrucomicrobiota bacterium]